MSSSKSKALETKYGSISKGRSAEQLEAFRRDKPKEKKPRTTIHDIKHHVESSDADNKHFFSRSSMKFFGQRMKDFKVHKTGGRYLRISAPMHDRTTGNRYMGQTERVYNPDKGELIRKPDAMRKAIRRHQEKK